MSIYVFLKLKDKKNMNFNAMVFVFQCIGICSFWSFKVFLTLLKQALPQQMRTLSHACVCDLEMVNVLKNVNYKSEDVCWFTKLARGWETRKEKASYGSDLLSLCSLYLTKRQNVGEYYLPFLPPFGKIIFYINSSLSLSHSFYMHLYMCMSACLTMIGCGFMDRLISAQVVISLTVMTLALVFHLTLALRCMTIIL